MGIVEHSSGESDIILDGFLKTIQYSVLGGLSIKKKRKRGFVVIGPTLLEKCGVAVQMTLQLLTKSIGQ